MRGTLSLTLSLFSYWLVDGFELYTKSGKMLLVNVEKWKGAGSYDFESITTVVIGRLSLKSEGGALRLQVECTSVCDAALEIVYNQTSSAVSLSISNGSHVPLKSPSEKYWTVIGRLTVHLSPTLLASASWRDSRVVRESRELSAEENVCALDVRRLEEPGVSVFICSNFTVQVTVLFASH